MPSRDTKYGLVTLEHEPRVVAEDEPRVVFLGRDAFLPGLLEVYASLAAVGGADPTFVEHAQALADRIRMWQRRNSDAVHIPD